MNDRPAVSKSRHVIKWVIIIGVLALIIYGVAKVSGDLMAPRTLVSVEGSTLRAEIVDTKSKRKKGLAGRDSIGSDEAMLFVFDKESKCPIWMKDMRMSIDIVWLDSSKRVVHVFPGAEPDAEPHTIYEAPATARYVLEMKDGTIKRLSIKKGSQVQFEQEGHK